MYEAIIGLEVHAQLATASKMFCACPVTDAAPPNTAVCPVCQGHPGALPVINAAAVELGVRAALATGCTVHPRSVFERKQYFYPDLPKGYQISQYERPLATAGRLHLDDGKVIGITRIHLEEDAGKTVHGEGGRQVDDNRAGVPLAEIVSEPDLRSAEDAETYLRTLHRVLVEAGVTTGDLEKGHFRCDANVSVHRPGEPWGTRTEIKNVNSFRFVAKAIASEIERQVAVLREGGVIVQETRTWRGATTVATRAKEGSSDYRYFPDPDLPPLGVDAATLARAREALPGAPLDLWLAAADAEREQAFRDLYGVDGPTARALLGNPPARALFEEAVAAGGASADMARWVTGEAARRWNEGIAPSAGVRGVALAELQSLVDRAVIALPVAKRVFEEVWARGGSPAEIVAAQGLGVVSDEAVLASAAREAIAANPDQLAKYKAGNPRVIGFFMGLVMKATGGRADPALARRVVVRELDSV